MTAKNDQEHSVRIFSIDFARSVCAVLIIAFHYACHTSSEYKFFLSTKTSDWGFIAVTVFFAVSGASLYFNHPEIKGLKKFYYKRWKSIFPMFYICFLYFFMQNVFRLHKVFYGPKPITLLYTILGMDGYLLYRYDNYYLVGEWFLGAIIILYFLYPAILWTMRKGRYILPIVLVFGNVIMMCTNLFIIARGRNLITCLTSFYLGIVGMKYSQLMNKNITLVGSSLLFILLTFFPVHFLQGRGFLYLQLIQSFSFLVVLCHVGEWIKNTSVSAAFSKISQISYPIFLFQHKIILNVQGVWDPHNWVKEIVIILITITITVICAKSLSVINDALLTSRTYKTIEEKLLSAR